MQEHIAAKKRLQGPRCKATTKVGAPCQALAGADGKCSAHSGRQDMRALGSKGGKGRRGPKPENVPLGLREELRKLDPAIVRGAIEQALSGNNESARVSAVKLLADVDAFRQGGDSCPRCEANAAEAPKARAKLDDLLERHIAAAMGVETSTNPRVRQHAGPDGSDISKTIARAVAKAREGKDADLVALIAEILARVRNGLKLAIHDPGAIEGVLRGLEEEGLLVRRHRVEELAQDRLKVLKAEHGVP